VNEDKFYNISPAWINNLRCEIEKKTAQKEDVELMMEYYNHFFKSNEGIPPEILEQISRLINQVFKEYLDRRENNQFYGTLDAAFGLTRKQGDRNTGRRNEDIATEVARYYIQRPNYSVRNAMLKVADERKLSATTIEDAWKRNKGEGIMRVRLAA